MVNDDAIQQNFFGWRIVIYFETSAKLIVQNLLISSYFCTFIV